MHSCLSDINHTRTTSNNNNNLKKTSATSKEDHRDSINIAAIPVAILCFQIMVQLAPNPSTLLAAVSAHVMRFLPIRGATLESDNVKVAPTSSART